MDIKEIDDFWAAVFWCSKCFIGTCTICEYHKDMRIKIRYELEKKEEKEERLT